MGDGESLADLHLRASHAAQVLSNTACKGGLLVVSHKLFLGMLARLDQGPTAFEAASGDQWDFTEQRLWTPPRQ